MVLSQLRSRRKPSGSRYKNVRSKKLSEKGRSPVLTKIEPIKTRTIKGRGSTSKLKALCADTANVYDPKKKTYKKAKLLTVVGNPANTNYVRRNIITKGTIVQTELGNARITNRPSQEGCVNATLVE
jgi:small subunit ribosomal protein S8e